MVPLLALVASNVAARPRPTALQASVHRVAKAMAKIAAIVIAARAPAPHLKPARLSSLLMVPPRQ